MPILGFGVYQNFDAKTSCLEAFEAGYRYASTKMYFLGEGTEIPTVDMSIRPRHIEMRLLSAKQYGKAVSTDLTCLSVREFRDR